jgi:hypothetical protein
MLQTLVFSSFLPCFGGISIYSKFSHMIPQDFCWMFKRRQ